MSGEYWLRKETEAARDLLRTLRDADAADDAELVEDSVEGETGLKEAIAAAINDMDETDALVAGLKAKEQQFAERRRVMEERVKRLRAAIEQAMMACGLETMRLPSATLSMRKTPPALVVESEAEIPSEFFTPQPAPAPKLDKDALKAALAEREIPGARMTNGGVSLTVRRV